HALVLQRLDDHFRAGHLAAIALPFHFATSLPGPSAVWPIKKALPGLSSRTTFRDGFRPSGRCAPELRGRSCRPWDQVSNRGETIGSPARMVNGYVRRRSAAGEERKLQCSPEHTKGRSSPPHHPPQSCESGGG